MLTSVYRFVEVDGGFGSLDEAQTIVDDGNAFECRLRYHLLHLLSVRDQSKVPSLPHVFERFTCKQYNTS